MRAFLVTICLATTSASWPATVTVTADPPLPVPNIIADPGIEQGDAAPPNWRFTTATPDNFSSGIADGGRSGRCLWLEAKSGVMSGYWNQTTTVQPGRTYVYKGFYRLGSGKLLAYVHGGVRLEDGRAAAVDQRFYQGTMRGHWLTPVFLPPDALGGPDPATWYPFSLTVAVPEAVTAVTLSLGLYFQAGEVWFDDLWAGLATTDLTVNVTAAEGETLRCVVLRRVDADAPALDSGDLGGATTYQGVAKDQPSDQAYEVEITLGDGSLVRERYPREEEGEMK